MTVDDSERPGFLSRARDFAEELKRRKVIKVTSVYLVGAWGLSAGAADIFEVLGLPDWASRYFVVTLFLCTPLVIVVAWLFELSKHGLHRDRGPQDSAREPYQATVVALQRDVPSLSITWMGKTQRFSSDFVAGRDDACGLQIADAMASRQHAKFEIYEKQWRVRDLDSVNGIIVDGEKVDSAILLRDSYVQFYPGGPKMLVSVRVSSVAETQLA